jgi:O-antigen/teichoic acid export membrane protein
VNPPFAGAEGAVSETADALVDASEADHRIGDTTTLARRGLLSFVGGVAFGLFNFLWIVIVARGWGGQRSGELFLGVAVFTITASVVIFGAEVGLVRAIAGAAATERHHDLRRMLVVAMAPVLALSLVVAALAPVLAKPAAELFVEGERGVDAVAQYVRILGLFIPFATLFMTMLAATRGLGTMSPTVFLEKFGRAGLQLVLAFVVVVSGAGAAAMALGYGVPFAVGAVAAAAWLSTRLRRAERRAESDPALASSLAQLGREFWRFSAPRGLASVFQAGSMWLDTLLVGGMLSAQAAGVYTASSRVLLVGSFFLLALIQAIGPQISAMFARGEPERAQAIYRTATWWLIALTWPLYLTTAIFAPAILRLYGPDFASGVSVVVIMSLAMLISMALGPIDIVLLMGGKSSWNLFNTIVSLVVNVALNLILIPRYGITGAAVSWAVSIAINNLLPAIQVRVVLGIDAFGRGFAVPCLAALACFAGVGGLVRALLGPTFLALAIASLVGSAIYAWLLWRSRELLQLGALWQVLRRPRAARTS